MHTTCTNIWFRFQIEFHVFEPNVAVYLVAKNKETDLKESALSLPIYYELCYDDCLGNNSNT